MDRREYQRRRFWLPVELDQPVRAFAVSHDASDNGLLLVCDRHLTVGSKVHLTIRIPTDETVEFRLYATVTRVSDNDEDPDGIWPHKAALRFDEPISELSEYLGTLSSPADIR
jgi:hypothetical protein